MYYNNYDAINFVMCTVYYCLLKLIIIIMLYMVHMTNIVLLHALYGIYMPQIGLTDMHSYIKSSHILELTVPRDIILRTHVFMHSLKGLVQSPCGKINIIMTSTLNFTPSPSSLNVTAFQHRLNTETLIQLLDHLT